MTEGLTELDGLTAVVTGGGSGIGRGMCRRFAARGMKVVVADIDADAARETVAGLTGDGAEAIAVECDVTDYAAVVALADTTLAEFGHVDVVCNNAGIFLGGAMRDFTVGDYEWTLAVNVMGVIHGGTAFTPYLVEQGRGHIVNTASIGGFSSASMCAPYSVSKFAVVAYTEAMRQDLTPEGVGVSMLCPGPIETGIEHADRLRPPTAGESKATSLAAIPVTHGGMDPDEVGDLVIRGIAKNSLYIFTHGAFGASFEPRLAEIRAAIDDTPEPKTGITTPQELGERAMRGASGH